MDASISQSLHGYPRADVEEFLAGAAAEKVRLEAEIADANARIARARSAVGSHRVMVTMLMEAQQELGEVRRTAELEAERILAEAELEAQAIERGARSGAIPADSAISAPSPRIDEIRFAPSAPSDATSMIDLGAGYDPDPSSDEFFDFLRGALTDEQPLGPAPE
jgi:cell division septum initiation protein DivIVA